MVEAVSCSVLITPMCFSGMLQFAHSASGFSVYHSALRLIAGVTDSTHRCTLCANAGFGLLIYMRPFAFLMDSRKFHIIMKVLMNAPGPSSLDKRSARHLNLSRNVPEWPVHSRMHHLLHRTSSIIPTIPEYTACSSTDDTIKDAPRLPDFVYTFQNVPHVRE